jgi:tRNA nucleotidyltransferase (CCA-adding enzyme)
VLRVARFAARLAPLGFRVADETQALMQRITASGELQHLVAERVWQELSRAMGEAAPQQCIRVLRDCGALAVILPEVDRLFGVPQPAAHHPEIDTGAHVLLALEQAARLSNNPDVRFAVLLHDLGKGLTPPSDWPRHIAHEHTGLPLVDAVCERLRAPRDARDLARLACTLHLKVHRALEMRPDTVLTLLEAADVFRRPERLPHLIAACEADARGRLGREQAPYPQAAFLQQAADCVRAISGESLADQTDLSGPAFGRALRSKRLDALKAWRTQHG